MLNVQFNLRALELDSNGWTQEFERKMNHVNRMAAVEWLLAVLTRVPVRTGMAASNLLPLGRYLSIRTGIPLFDLINVEPVQEPDRRKEGEWYAESPEASFSSTGKGTFYFRFSIKVPHYFLNEYFAMHYKNPIDPSIITPWMSMEAGRAAYKRFIQDNAPGMVPRVGRFIVKSKNYAMGI